MSNIYDKVEKFVQISFKDNSVQMRHFRRTVYWVKQLKHNADEALLIAAISHDIERAFREDKGEQTQRAKKSGFKDEEFLRFHEEKGAQIVGDFLEKEVAPENLIERVKMLISRHEEGGNDDQNLLKDADSVSFFENNIEYFLTVQVEKFGKKIVKEKLDWMYDRITSPEAKKIAKDWYEKSIENL